MYLLMYLQTYTCPMYMWRMSHVYLGSRIRIYEYGVDLNLLRLCCNVLSHICVESHIHIGLTLYMYGAAITCIENDRCARPRRSGSAEHCNTLQLTATQGAAITCVHWDWQILAPGTGITALHTATHCNTLQHLQHMKHTATHCNTLQHTATQYNTLQLTATHCNAGRNNYVHASKRTVSRLCHNNHSATHCNTLQHTCNILQHTATHCNTLQHTATHCNTGRKNYVHASKRPCTSARNQSRGTSPCLCNNTPGKISVAGLCCRSVLQGSVAF